MTLIITVTMLILLTLTVSDFLRCHDDEFRCHSGECLLAYMRCDGDYDCEDNSDEFNCKTEYVFRILKFIEHGHHTIS